MSRRTPSLISIAVSLIRSVLLPSWIQPRRATGSGASAAARSVHASNRDCIASTSTSRLRTFRRALAVEQHAAVGQIDRKFGEVLHVDYRVHGPLEVVDVGRLDGWCFVDLAGQRLVNVADRRVWARRNATSSASTRVFGPGLTATRFPAEARDRARPSPTRGRCLSASARRKQSRGDDARTGARCVRQRGPHRFGQSTSSRTIFAMSPAASLIPSAAPTIRGRARAVPCVRGLPCSHQEAHPRAQLEDIHPLFQSGAPPSQSGSLWWSTAEYERSINSSAVSFISQYVLDADGLVLDRCRRQLALEQVHPVSRPADEKTFSADGSSDRPGDAAFRHGFARAQRTHGQDQCSTGPICARTPTGTRRPREPRGGCRPRRVARARRAVARTESTRRRLTPRSQPDHQEDRHARRRRKEEEREEAIERSREQKPRSRRSRKRGRPEDELKNECSRSHSSPRNVPLGSTSATTSGIGAGVRRLARSSPTRLRPLRPRRGARHHRRGTRRQDDRCRLLLPQRRAHSSSMP